MKIAVFEATDNSQVRELEINEFLSKVDLKEIHTSSSGTTSKSWHFITILYETKPIEEETK